jgi:hypothetical protein
MWSSVALAAALSLAPAQPGGLQLTNVRLTVGELGPPRASARVLPGEVLFIAYDIDGLTIDKSGVVKYTMGMEVQDAAGRPVFKQEPQELPETLPLGGNKLPARVFITIGLDQPAGMYTCKVTITDTVNKASNNLSVKFEVLPKDFGIVQVFTSYDPEGKFVAPTAGQVGQMLYIHHSVPDFKRDPKTKQPDVEFKYSIVDEKGQPTLPQPFVTRQDAMSPFKIDEKAGMFARFFPVFLTRPGKFTVKITATDKVGNKTATYDLPITVTQGQ